MEFKIEKNVPMPRSMPRSKFPFASMEVGDSCFLEKEISCIHAYTRHLKPKKFSGRTVTEDGIKGIRIWRIE